MAMTMTQKIFCRGAGMTEVKADMLINARVDAVLGNDITAPPAISEFEKYGFTKVFDKEKIILVPDHFCPNKDIKSAEQAKIMRDFAKKQEIVNYFEVGKMGIEHALIPEQGLVTAGDIVVGADSHTCTYGALGAFSTGVGSTDMAAAMASGELWFKVPPAVKVEIKGDFKGKVSGKDVILALIGKIGVDGARYKSLEFCGDGIKNLSMDDRLTIANMAIEAGAKNGIFPVDEITLKYLSEHGAKTPEIFEADADAEYDETVVIDLSELDYTVACPHLPSNVKPASQLSDIAVDQVVNRFVHQRQNQRPARCCGNIEGQKNSRRSKVHCNPGYTENLFKGNGRGPFGDIRKRRCGGKYTHVRSVPWRIYGYPCLGRDLRCYNKPKFCGQNGRKGQQNLPCKPGCCSCVRRMRKDCPSGGGTMIIQGRVHIFNDNVDTDVIIPARYLNTFDLSELASHCMEDIDPEFSKKVVSGDIIVAG